MVSSRPSITLLVVSCILTGVTLLSAQAHWDRSDFESFAREVSIATDPASFPGAEFAPSSFSLFPAVYRPEGRTSQGALLPILGLQWWVSPNLAFMGALGSGIGDGQVVQYQRIGFEFLPGIMGIGPLNPAIAFVQGRIDGLPAYTLKWNEMRWGYTARLEPWHAGVAVLFVFQHIFPKAEASAPDVPRKISLTSRALALMAGYDLVPGFRLSLRAIIVNPDLYSGGAQLSLAI
ncbi:MAG: hypothetical protein IIB42_03305 [Candidatus Marinimicrobia bacterium]|nr:hypothetical protein [Candidatus Neomarinimicrobiota bacterium]